MSDLIVKVTQIEEVMRHPNADRLDIVKVFGWYTIVGKDMYQVGDLVTYVPIDAVFTLEKAKELGLTYMLNTDQTALRSGGRVKTIKLRDCISQGLILPAPKGFNEGDDVAEFYDIRKYEEPTPKYQTGVGTGKSKKRKNPNFAEYTKPSNIKFYPSVFDGDGVVITEKIHGTNFRAGKLPYTPRTRWEKIRHAVAKVFGIASTHEFVYGSHRVQISGNNKYKGFYGTDLYGQIAEKYRLQEIVPDGYVVYGEIYGQGVQDLTYGIKGTDLVVFDVMKDGVYLDYIDFRGFCLDRDLPMAPLLYIGDFEQGLIAEYTNGNSVMRHAHNQIREGCVIKPIREKNDPRIGRKVLKSISEEYLLRDGATEFH